MHLTGRAEGPPCAAPAGLVRPLTALGNALAAATRLMGRQVAADAVGLLAERAAYTGFGRAGWRTVGGQGQMVRSADGWIALNLPRPSDVAALPALVGGAVAAGEDWVGVTRRLAEMPSSEVVNTACLLGLAASAVGECSEPSGGDGNGRDQKLGTAWPWTLWRPETHSARRRPAPALGRIEAAASLRHPAGLRHAALGPDRKAPVVLDLTSLWAGPLAGRLLAAAGARVIKVESVGRPDGARRGPAGFFARLNGRKEHARLDLPEPGGVERLKEMIAGADLVLESSRPRVMRQWGISVRAAVEAGTSWVSITGYGRRGRGRNRVAFGDDAAAAGGLVAPGDPPLFAADAAADPITGLAAAAIAARLLADRRAALADLALATVSAWAAARAGPPMHGPATRSGGGWTVELAGAEVPVRPPSVRRLIHTAHRQAAAMTVASPH